MPGSIRLFVVDALHAGANFALSAAQAHYLGSVMRRSVGDALRLFNGRDGEFSARIERIRRGKATVIVEGLLRPQAPETDLWLAFTPLKRDATDLLVQKATELGVAALLPVMTERTNASRVNLERLAAIATEAAEQSERLSVPRLHPPAPLHALLADWPAERILFVALERSDSPAIRPASGPAGILIGPEGGFSPLDRTLIQNGHQCTQVSLGPRILRAETAAIVALALLQAPDYG